MSLAEVVDDLLALEDLAALERDPEKRRSLELVRGHLAGRERGVKVSEAASVSLATAKRVVDLLRKHGHDRDFLVAVMRILRDRAALEGSEEAFAD